MLREFFSKFTFPPDETRHNSNGTVESLTRTGVTREFLGRRHSAGALRARAAACILSAGKPKIEFRNHILIYPVEWMAGRLHSQGGSAFYAQVKLRTSREET
jgi:hypothetical protein